LKAAYLTESMLILIPKSYGR